MLDGYSDFLCMRTDLLVGQQAKRCKTSGSMANSAVVPDNRRYVPGKRYWARQINLDYRCTLSRQVIPIGATID